LAKVLKCLQVGDLVIVTALDRLGRSLKDVLDVLETISLKGAKFRSLKEPFFDSSSEMGMFLIQIIGSVAQLERSLIIQRTSEGRKRAIARGVIMGRKPKLNAYQRTEAVKRHENGEFMSDIARSYNVSTATICRLIQHVTN
jgi:DNA invertase Pin-like site-specific DNA recombinase